MVTIIDLGVSIDLSYSYRLGWTVRKLITDKFDVDLSVVNSSPLTSIINIDTEARVELAYRKQLLTLAADYDLIENEPLLANPAFENLKSQ